MSAPEPTLARKIAAGIATAIIVAAVSWVIHVRSAPPLPGM